jgi:hypothetical protein
LYIAVLNQFLFWDRCNSSDLWAMAHATSCRIITAETPSHSQANAYGV